MIDSESDYKALYHIGHPSAASWLRFVSVSVQEYVSCHGASGRLHFSGQMSHAAEDNHQCRHFWTLVYFLYVLGCMRDTVCISLSFHLNYLTIGWQLIYLHRTC